MFPPKDAPILSWGRSGEDSFGGGCLGRMIQPPGLAKSCFMLFTAFIETWRISSDSRVFYARLVIDKCDQRPRTTLSSKKLK